MWEIIRLLLSEHLNMILNYLEPRGNKRSEDRIRYFWGCNCLVGITWVLTPSSSDHLFTRTVRGDAVPASLTLSLPGHCRVSTKLQVCESERGRSRFNESSGICIRFILSVLRRHLCPEPSPQHALPATLITSPFFFFQGDPQNWQTGAVILIN